VDSAAWLGFLRLLKKFRGRQPLNGALLTISISDLCDPDEGRRADHARAMRKRIAELGDELGVRVPVYVLLTKADQLAGFAEFFDGASREERDQVWGMTLALDDGRDAEGAVAQVPAAFDALLARLNERMLERIDRETDPQRRRAIFGFPQQVASLRETLLPFLTDIFKPSKLEARPLLRGVYLTSGTQDGTQIDRLLSGMAAQFGLTRQAVAGFSGSGRSYFLTRLVGEVVFGEAGLVSADPKVERRAAWMARGTYAAAALTLAVLSTIWTVSYLGNAALVADIHANVGRYNAAVHELAARGAQDTDLPAVLPALDLLRNMRGGYAEHEKPPPWTMTFGLYQGHKLNAAAVDAYVRALNGYLLPRLLARLENQLASHTDQQDFLYEGLKVYLILGRQGPLDADTVQRWMALDLAANYPGDDNAETRAALLTHIGALLEHPLSALPLDGALITRVRGILTQEPLSLYSYNRMIHSRRARELPDWTVAENAGAEAGRVLTLRSGHALSTGVPGIFTTAGYHGTFLQLLATVTQDITEDRWVLGLPDHGVAATVAETARLRRDVLGLYLDDYVRKWDALIGDVALKPFTDVNTGADELSRLSGPASPLRELLQSIDHETQLSHVSGLSAAQDQAEGAAAKAAKKAGGFASLEARAGLSNQENALVEILGGGFGKGGGTKPENPTDRVEQHFKWIHDFTAGHDGLPSPMEAAITKMATMAQNMTAVAGAANPGAALLAQVAGGGGGGGGGAGGAAAQLQAMAKDLPPPVAAMLHTVAASSAAIVSGGAGQSLADAWRSKVLPLCQAAFDRYPFVAGSTADVPLDDFARLLAPGGLMDGFFNDYLRPLVDTGVTPWRWQSADHADLNLSAETLVQFQRAAQIRDALYPSGTQMQVRFTLVPLSLDASLAKITVDIAGHALTYDHGPTQSAGFVWPAADGRTLVRVTLVGAGGAETVVEQDGPWALLHLLDHATIIPSGQPDQFRLVFTANGATAAFQLNASSVRNPFTLAAFRSFRCPARL